MIKYWIAKIKSKVKRSREPMISYYRSGGAKIGTGCLICSNVLTREPY